MKQLIVLIATIILGIAIAGFIMGFGDTAEDLQESANTKIETVFEFNKTK